MTPPALRSGHGNRLHHHILGSASPATTIGPAPCNVEPNRPTMNC